MRIGWIGAGLMGHPMLERVVNAGHEVSLFTRSGHPATLEAKVEVASTLAELVRSSDVIVTIVGGPQDVQDLYLSEQGLLAAANSGQLFVDMTTSSVGLAERLGASAAERGLEMLDAPVSGGPYGAEAGTLSIMVGGSASGFKRATPLFEHLGRVVVHHGGNGSGQAAKLVNQLMVAAVTEACAEGHLLAREVGLDLSKLSQSIAAGAAGSSLAQFLFDRLGRDDATPGFKISHLRKDLTLLLDEAERQQLTLPLAEMARDAALEAESLRGGDVGTQLIGARSGLLHGDR